MLDSLYIGATGMQVQQLNVDTVANNLANVNTVGYKRSRIDFEDLLYRSVATTSQAGTTTAAATEGGKGMGAAVASVGKVFTVGDVKKTDEPLDLAISGQGFFEIQMPDGTLAYTRNGAFQMNADGTLVTRDGYPLNASIQVPADTTSIQVGANGQVLATVAGENRAVDLGQIELTTFQNPAGLTALGDNLFVPTENSGIATPQVPGESGAGLLRQGFLESSNVRLIDEMVALIVAQRAYEINAKVVQASDELLSISNSLYR